MKPKSNTELKHEQLTAALKKKQLQQYTCEAQLLDKAFLRDASLQQVQAKKKEHNTLFREAAVIERKIAKIEERLS